MGEVFSSDWGVLGWNMLKSFAVTGVCWVGICSKIFSCDWCVMG